MSKNRWINGISAAIALFAVVVSGIQIINANPMMSMLTGGCKAKSAADLKDLRCGEKDKFPNICEGGGSGAICDGDNHCAPDANMAKTRDSFCREKCKDAGDPGEEKCADWAKCLECLRSKQANGDLCHCMPKPVKTGTNPGTVVPNTQTGL